MAQDNAPPVLVKKVRKGAHHHHGGAWKVAYADFVTAMMAFFLLLWLLNATTEEQRRGIAEYFTPTAVSTSASGAGGILAGRSLSPDGVMATPGGAPSVSLELRPTSGASDGDADEDTGGGAATDAALSEAQLREELARLEEEQFRKAEAEIRQAIQESPELRELEQNLIVDRTPEGLRIQIVDQEGRSMFPRGSAAMLDRTRELLHKIAGVIKALPNKLSISGHTDSTPYRGGGGFSNWELSASRANASRRELIAAGLSPERVARVVGRADKEPLVKEDPTSPRNRRIAIVLLRQKPAGGGAAQASRAAPRPVQPFKKDWTGPRLR